MSSSSSPAITAGVDVRGPRFTAWVTSAVLTAILVISAFSPVAAAIALGLQTVVFAIGAFAGPRRHPYGLVFATVVAPRLGPVREREPIPPLKFAQLLGFFFAASGVVGLAVGPLVVGTVATALALVAAFLNAAFGICLGCELYPLAARLRRSPGAA
ncbi:hypothetical protein MB901379_04258 [Mycobacterium basiliense]|uniref:DUF4395 domain-containing protein n=1 Tax=Mycobacterium basiliense TaxID=2094119 RepID=A0A3S4BIU1_9MYCO|nr:DUF4395 domain-containing protein [Mycobacterium basiliense]VDM90651.1 hypothetical protein MB901379_04258 [Mycobacterium basiliense]